MDCLSAYTNANTALTTYTAASPEFITIVAATWNNIAAYYPKRQAVLDKIAVAAKAYADTVANNAVEDLEIGGRNLFLDSGRLLKNGNYNIAIYTTSVDLVAGEKYTIALRGTTTGGQKLGAYMNAGNSTVANFKVNMTDEVAYISFTAIAPNAANIRKIHIYNLPSSGCAANPATIKWAALYEGVVKPPSDWIAAPEDVINETVLTRSKLWAGQIIEANGIAMTAIQEDYNKADGLLGKLKAQVSVNMKGIENRVTKDTYDLLNGVVNRHETRIAQTETDIALMVKKDDIITGITIKPNLIELTGATVIKDAYGNKVNIFGIGDKAISINGGVFSVDNVGKVIASDVEITGGKFMGFKLSQGVLMTDSLNANASLAISSGGQAGYLTNVGLRYLNKKTDAEITIGTYGAGVEFTVMNCDILHGGAFRGNQIFATGQVQVGASYSSSGFLEVNGNVRLNIRSGNKMYITGLPHYLNAGETDSYYFMLVHTSTGRIAYIKK